MDGKGLSKGRNAVIIAALIISNFFYMSGQPFITVAEDIYASFPDAPSVVLSFCISGGAITFGIGSLMTAGIAAKLGSKKTFIIGCAVSTLCGVGCTLVNSAYYLSFIRIILGFSSAMSTTTGYYLISEFFVDEKSVSSINGIYAAAAMVIGTALAMITSVVCADGWTKVPYILAAGIPITIFCFFAIPGKRKAEAAAASAAAEVAEPAEAVEDEAPVQEIAQASSEPARPPITTAELIGPVLALILSCTAYMGFYYCIATLVVNKGFTDLTTVGLASSAIQLPGLITLLFLGVYYVRYKKALPIVLGAGSVLGAVIFYFAPNIPIMMLGLGLIGLCFNGYFGYCTVALPSLNPAHASMMTSLCTFSIGLFGFVAMVLMEIFTIDGTMLGAVPFLIGCYAVSFILEATLCARARKGRI